MQSERRHQWWAKCHQQLQLSTSPSLLFFFNALWWHMGEEIAPSKTLTLQLYHLEHTTYLCTATRLSQVCIFITNLFKISTKFLPPRQSTSLPIYDNVFYSPCYKRKSHRGQREQQHCAELLRLLQELLMKSFGLLVVTMLGMGSFVHHEKRDLQKAYIRSPMSPHSILEQQWYGRELPKLNRLSFPGPER